MKTCFPTGWMQLMSSLQMIYTVLLLFPFPFPIPNPLPPLLSSEHFLFITLFPKSRVAESLEKTLCKILKVCFLFSATSSWAYSETDEWSFGLTNHVYSQVMELCVSSLLTKGLFGLQQRKSSSLPALEVLPDMYLYAMQYITCPWTKMPSWCQRSLSIYSVCIGKMNTWMTFWMNLFHGKSGQKK